MKKAVRRIIRLDKLVKFNHDPDKDQRVRTGSADDGTHSCLSVSYLPHGSDMLVIFSLSLCMCVCR